MSAGKIRVGVGGWNYDAWRGEFYPKGLPHSQELDYASRHLSSIEINGTFYRTPSAETFQKWHDETPDDFVFSLKAPRFAMNRKVLGTAGESVDRFVESGLKNLKSKLGPINWQLGPNKKFDAADMEEFLKLLPKELKHALEVRHESFKCAEFIELARSYGVAIILAGDSEHPLIPDVTAPFVYARLMGTTEEANGYPAPDIDAWAERFRSFASGGSAQGLPYVSSAPAEGAPRDVFVYFISGFKQSNPKTAMEFMSRQG